MSPELSRFNGIRVMMFKDDHNPPHFHAETAEFEASYRISTLELLDGKLPRRAEELVLEWAEKHRQELADNWFSLADGGTFQKIVPLGDEE